MDPLHPIVNDNEQTPAQKAKALWAFHNDRIREKLDIDRPSPSVNDLVAHLKYSRQFPDDEFLAAVEATQTRALTLANQLHGESSLQVAEANAMTGALWDAVLKLVHASRDHGDEVFMAAMAVITDLEIVAIAAGVRPWRPVIKPLLEHWYVNGATLARINTHPYPLLANGFANSHIPEVVMAGRALPLIPGQVALPGFEDVGSPMRQSLLVDVLDLGSLYSRKGSHRGGGKGAPLAARAWIACVLGAPAASWHWPARIQITVREFLQRVYRDQTWKRGIALTRQLEKLQNDVFRISVDVPRRSSWIHDRIRPVVIDQIPIDSRTGYVELDEMMEFQVRIPMGANQLGVPADFNRLHAVGLESAPGYRALLNLYYTWHQHNRTLKWSGNDIWTQSHDPDDYKWLTSSQQTALAFPKQLMEGRSGRYMAGRALMAWEKLRDLGAATPIVHPDKRRVKLLPPQDFGQCPDAGAVPTSDDGPRADTN